MYVFLAHDVAYESARLQSSFFMRFYPTKILNNPVIYLVKNIFIRAMNFLKMNNYLTVLPVLHDFTFQIKHFDGFNSVIFQTHFA